MYKNIYGGKIAVYFGDTEPTDFIVYNENTKELVLANENYGKFSKEIADKIISDYELFKQTYAWSDIIFKWVDKELIRR